MNDAPDTTQNRRLCLRCHLPHTSGESISPLRHFSAHSFQNPLSRASHHIAICHPHPIIVLAGSDHLIVLSQPRQYRHTGLIARRPRHSTSRTAPQSRGSPSTVPDCLAHRQCICLLSVIYVLHVLLSPAIASLPPLSTRPFMHRYPSAGLGGSQGVPVLCSDVPWMAGRRESTLQR